MVFDVVIARGKNNNTMPDPLVMFQILGSIKAITVVAVLLIGVLPSAVVNFAKIAVAGF